MVVFGMSSCVCCGGVACFRWWLGGNCYHRRCVAACRRRVGGLWSQNPRVVAQSAVHLGEIWVTWGVWGVVDDGSGVVASPCGVAGSARAVLGVFQWVRLLPMSEVVWWRGSCSTSLSSCPGGVACLCWWLGGNCYHRRCLAACRRRVGGLWSQNPPSGCSEGPASRACGGVYGSKSPVWLLKVQSTSVKSG